jgi:hypothetical protein
MIPQRLAFIDWMKVVGMLLIVLGHTGAQELFAPTPPFNFKQLGVAFFVFVMGFSLAGETRSPWLVFYNRIFEVWLFGLAFALVMSLVTWLTIGDLAESNYLPLFFGVNVAFNFFPANPTTWYIGTYFHLLLLWVLVLRRIHVRPWMIVLSFVAEIIIRAALIPSAGGLVAYMALTNWGTVFLLGLWSGQQREVCAPKGNGLYLPAGELIALFALLALWPALIGRMEVGEEFPFALVGGLSSRAPWLATSAAVSFLYLAHTWLVFRLAQRLPSLKGVEFLARNTLIVFIIHMPLIYWLCPHFYPLVPQGGLRVLANVILFFLLPACLSELIRWTFRPVWWRDQLRQKVVSRWTQALPTPGRAP